MIDKYEILKAAKFLGIQPTTVEKDYVLGWMLMGIQEHTESKGNWIFKGGTCLKNSSSDVRIYSTTSSKSYPII